MEKDQILFLKDRGVIYISGEEAKDFLQNITNDINKVSDTEAVFRLAFSTRKNIYLTLWS